ncbi:hypothetical protein ZEAMMB73_Zm00001d035413 [Zea mays]|uniref:Uncharacterized protein n=1 Tax=Zea mays TaxID=4577 RepID=A0A1D6LGB5_MAIZE|nr:hypothetical protein ZEAMMB73_Zm00001d035413 [Zea mays]
MSPPRDLPARLLRQPMPDGRPTSDASSPVRSSSPPLRCVAPPVVTSAPFTDLSWVLHTLLVTIVMREALKGIDMLSFVSIKTRAVLLI